MGRTGNDHSGSSRDLLTRDLGPEVERVLADLDSGKGAAQPALAHATDALLQAFWQSPGSQGIVKNGLAQIYSHVPATGQARILGEVLSAGPPATPLLEQLAGQHSFLTPEETEALKDLLSKSVPERLEALILLLAKATGERDSGRMPSPVRPGAELQPFKSEGDEFKPEKTADTPKADGPPDLEKDLLDSNLPPEDRMQAALELGPRAIGILTGLLESDNPNERELAQVALTSLMQQNGSQRAVHDAMVPLERKAAVRHAAEAIRRSADRSAFDQKEVSRTRDRIKNAQTPDGWLSRALSRCDGMAIMQAAAGREILVIPRVLELFARRRVHSNSK